jgi:hypothetical protein
MTGLLIIGALLAAFALVAPRYGADTRTSDGWTGGRSRRALPRTRHEDRADPAAVWAAATPASGHPRAGMCL